MPKRIEKYSNTSKAVKSGYRRVRKRELLELGYSAKSVLYTKADVKNPKKFLTRADVYRVIKPLKDAELKRVFAFPEVKKQRIKAARRKTVRHTHTVYSDYLKPITLEQAIVLTERFLDFLEKRYSPVWRNQIGMIYKGVDDDFSIQPRLWRDRKELILDDLKNKLKKYKAKIKIIFIIGWIEQSK